MEEKTTVVIDIQLDDKGVADRLAEVNREMAGLKDTNQQLRKDVKDGNKTWEEVSATLAENEAKLKTLKAEQSALSGQVAQATAKNREYGSSLKEQSALLNDLRNRYQSLSEEQRNSKGGKEMLKQIQDLDAKMKSADGSIGLFQRNVGDYANQIAKISGLFGSAGSAATSLAGKVGTAAKGFSALVAIPIVAVFVAVVAIIKKLSDTIKGSEAQTMKWKETMAVFEPILNAIKNGFTALASILIDTVQVAIKGVTVAINGLAKAADWVGSVFGADWGLSRKTEELKAQASAQRELTKAENEYIINKRAWGIETAKIDRDVADLRAKAADKENYTNQQRLDFLQQAIDKETERATKEKELAEENLRLLRIRAAQTENDAEMNDKLAQAEIAVIEADTKLADTKRNLNNERQSAIEQGKKEIDTAKKYADLVATEMAKAEKALISLIEDGAQKRIALENNQYEESKKKLQSSLEYARKKYGEQSELYKAYATQLEAIEKTHAKALEDIERANSAEAIKIQEDVISRQLALVQKGTAEEFALRRELLGKKKDEELLNEKLTAEQRLLIEQQYQYDLQKLDEDEAKARQDKERKILENRIDEMKQAYQNTGELELQLLQQNIDNLAQLQGESDEDFYARRLAAQKAYNDKKKALDAAEMAMEKTKANYMASIAGSISSLMEEVSDDNKAMVKASKIVALAEVAIKQGVAISEAVASSAAGDPYTYALRVASAIASTVAAMASAIASINKASFETGGVIGGYRGATMGTDNTYIHARQGEMVLNAEQQRQLFEVANGGSMGSSLTASLVAALQAMPAPVLEYSEFARFQGRLVNLNESQKLK